MLLSRLLGSEMLVSAYLLEPQEAGHWCQLQLGVPGARELGALSTCMSPLQMRSAPKTWPALVGRSSTTSGPSLTY